MSENKVSSNSTTRETCTCTCSRGLGLLDETFTQIRKFNPITRNCGCECPCRPNYRIIEPQSTIQRIENAKIDELEPPGSDSLVAEALNRNKIGQAKGCTCACSPTNCLCSCANAACSCKCTDNACTCACTCSRAFDTLWFKKPQK